MMINSAEKLNYCLDRPQLFSELLHLAILIIEKIQDQQNPIQQMSRLAQVTNPLPSVNFLVEILIYQFFYCKEFTYLIVPKDFSF